MTLVEFLDSLENIHPVNLQTLTSIHISLGENYQILLYFMISPNMFIFYMQSGKFYISIKDESTTLCFFVMTKSNFFFGKVYNVKHTKSLLLPLVYERSQEAW